MMELDLKHVQPIWDVIVEKCSLTAQKISSTTSDENEVLPINVLLLLAEKLLFEIDTMVISCLQNKKPEDSSFRPHIVRFPRQLMPVLSSPHLIRNGSAWTKSMKEIPESRKTWFSIPNSSNLNCIANASDKKIHREAEVSQKETYAQNGQSQRESSLPKIDFYIKNDRLMCMMPSCIESKGFSSFFALKKHLKTIHFNGHSNADVDSIPNFGLRSIETLKVEPDFFQDDPSSSNEVSSDGSVSDSEWQPGPGVKEENENTGHNCEHCLERFKSEKLLEKHRKKYHKSDKTCGNCSKVFKDEHALESHLEMCSKSKESSCVKEDDPDVPEEKRTCMFCREVLPTRVLLLKHERSHSGPFKCPDCGTVLANKDIFKQHLKDLHTTSSDSICEECGMSFKNRRYLWGHMRNHHTQKFVLCTDCGKHFKPSAYRDHRKYKHSATPLTRIHCEDCGNTFRSKLTLKTHQAIVHGKGDRTVLQCEQCPRKCTSESQLKRHVMSAHLGLKQHVCPQCSKEFCHKDSLKKHQALTHGLGDQKVFKCSQCPKKFVSESRMKEHVMVLHEGLKYQCPNCTKEFSRKSSMMKHLRNGKCSNGGSSVSSANVERPDIQSVKETQ